MRRRHSPRAVRPTPAPSAGRSAPGRSGRGNGWRQARLAEVRGAVDAAVAGLGDADAVLFDARASLERARTDEAAAAAANAAAEDALREARAAEAAARAQAAEAAAAAARAEAARAEAAQAEADAAPQHGGPDDPASPGDAPTSAAPTSAPRFGAERRAGPRRGGRRPVRMARPPTKGRGALRDEAAPSRGGAQESAGREDRVSIAIGGAASPDAVVLAAAATADASAQAASASQALSSAQATTTQADATTVAAQAAQVDAQTQVANAETAAAQAQAEAQAAQDSEETKALAEQVVGEDVSVEELLRQAPAALGGMGLEQYADRPEVAAAAADAMASGDWKALRRAGLTEDEAKAVFNTVEAVRIGVENSSHAVSFKDGTVIDDQVGRDEIVIPGVQSFDELDQSRDGDDLILATAEGEVRVVGFYDKSRGNVARIRLGDSDSDKHADTALYREELLLQGEIDSGEYREKYGINGQLDWWDMDLMLAPGEEKAHRARYKSEDTRMREARDSGMHAWGESQSEDVRTLMFGASNRDSKEMKRGHRKILNRHYDARQDYGRGRGAESLAMADKALQDLSFFTSVDDARKEKHLKNIAKKGQKSSFLGKVLGIVGAVVSFFNPIVGAVLTGVATIAQGGSILDGIKAGLGSYMAGGAFGGGAVERVAGTALSSDGDPAAIGLAAVGAAVQNTQLGDVLSENNIRIDGGGVNVGLGSTPLSFGLNSSLDVGAGVEFEGGSVDFSEGGLLTLNVEHGDFRGSVTDEGALTLQHNLTEYTGAATTWAGLSLGANGGLNVVGDQLRTGADGFTSFTSGTIDLQTGEATTTVTSDASLGDVVDQLRDGQRDGFLPLWPTVDTGEPQVDDNIPATVNIDADVFEEREDFSAPEQDEYLDEIMADVERVAPAGEIEEVVVTAPYLGPELGMTTAPGRSDSERTDGGPTAGEGGLSSQEDVNEAKEEVAKAALALAELYGSSLAGAGNQILDLQDAVEKVQKAFDDPTPTNIMAAQAAVNKVLGDLAEVVKHPNSALAKEFASVAGVASNLVAFADESLPLNDRLRAAVSIVGAMGGPGAKRASQLFLATNDVGSALYTFGNSAGAVDPYTGRTPFQETADEALAVELAARAQGDAYEAAIRDTGAATAAALAEVTGLDVADEVGAVFDAVGSRTGRLFDDVGHAVAVTHVVTSALGDALEGSIRATVNLFGD